MGIILEGCLKEIHDICQIITENIKYNKKTFLKELWIYLFASLYITILAHHNKNIILLTKYAVFTFYNSIITLSKPQNISYTLYIFSFMISLYDFSILHNSYDRFVDVIFDIIYIYKNHQLQSVIHRPDVSVYMKFLLSFIYDLATYTKQTSVFISIIIHIIRFHVFKHNTFEKICESLINTKQNRNTSDFTYSYNWINYFLDFSQLDITIFIESNIDSLETIISDNKIEAILQFEKQQTQYNITTKYFDVKHTIESSNLLKTSNDIKIQCLVKYTYKEKNFLNNLIKIKLPNIQLNNHTKTIINYTLELFYITLFGVSIHKIFSVKNLHHFN